MVKTPPAARPANPRFSSGPCTKIPGFSPIPPKKPKPPMRPRRTKPLLVPRATATRKYPGKPTEILDTPGRRRAPGPECQAWLSHTNGVLNVKIVVKLHKPLTAESAPKWTKADGAELCFSYPDKNAQHPTFVLHGFPSGTFESSTEAGAPAPLAENLRKKVHYSALVGEKTRTAEWAVPLSAVDIEAPDGLELDFNIGIFRRESKQWIQWAGTGSQTWLVERAGRIQLGK